LPDHNPIVITYRRESMTASELVLLMSDGTRENLDPGPPKGGGVLLLGR
jgi:hypothetical protein